MQEARQNEQSTCRSLLVAIQPGGCKPPFFCVPGNDGNVFTDIGPLARNLGLDQPCYGFQGGAYNPTNVRAVAARYLGEIRAVQAGGPYVLGGVCSGGIVAFEMALQLQAQGQHVAVLALVDPPPPPSPSLRSYVSCAASISRLVVQHLGYPSGSGLQRGAGGQGTDLRLKAQAVASEWAMVRYAPRPYSGRIHLFLTSESLSVPHNPQLDWQELATGSAELHVIPSSHDAAAGNGGALVEESAVRALTEQLRTCIDGALANGYRF